MHAATMPVRLFREILIWPLALTTAGKEADKAVENAVLALERPGGPWERVDDPGGGEGLCRDAYAEIVYFHPFVQSVLFTRSRPDRQPAVRRYRRSGVRGLSFTLPSGDPMGPHRFEFAVERVILTLFNSGTAVLAVEVASDDGYARRDGDGIAQPMTLADAQIVLCRLRRAFPAYWHPEKDWPAECVTDVAWLGGGVTMPEEPDGCWLRTLKERERPPAFRHWRALLDPLPFEAHADENPPVSLRHVTDERIPTMALIGVDHPADITRGDWVRLCFCDAPGTAPLPYAEDFLASFEKEHCYDRFWHLGEGWLNTRYLCAGYNFAVIGQDGGPDSGSFLRKTLLTHFSRHYFQLGLISHFQKAALLTLSDSLAETIARHSDALTGDPGPVAEAEALETLRGAVQRLRWRVLDFTHRYWFPDVSNHLQAQELFQWWRHHLGTQALYDQLAHEVAESGNFLDARSQDEMARSQEKMARAAMRLNRLAGAGLFLALLTGALGMNVLVGSQWNNPAHWVEAVMMASGLGALTLFAWPWVTGDKRSWAWGSRNGWIPVLIVVVMMMFFTLRGLGWKTDPPPATVAVTVSGACRPPGEGEHDEPAPAVLSGRP